MKVMDWKTYQTLFLSTLKISACTFGGGFVIIPLMRKKFVEQLGWIDEQEMLDFAAIAQSSPGAIAINASILVGYHVAGVVGALMTVLGTIIPPLVNAACIYNIPNSDLTKWPLIQQLNKSISNCFFSITGHGAHLLICFPNVTVQQGQKFESSKRRK